MLCNTMQCSAVKVIARKWAYLFLQQELINKVTTGTSSKLSPTRASRSRFPFLSIILEALADFFKDVKSKTAMSGVPFAFWTSFRLDGNL